MNPEIWKFAAAGICLAGTLLAAEVPTGASADGERAPAFTVSGDGFAFHTGVVRGYLHAGGPQRLGLTSVIHVPSGRRLDGSHGLLSHYRVFSKGIRYGAGAWDWPSHATLRPDGAVQIEWPPAHDRPFEMRAVYRWRSPEILDLETTVKAQRKLPGFEAFLASYFSDGFTNAAVRVRSLPGTGNPGFLPALEDHGVWQMFARDDAILPLIQDGRWQLQPHPVDWVLQPQLEYPAAFRRHPESGLTVALMGRPKDCFAIASPHQSESHYSLYLSLFGRDLNPGDTTTARTRLLIAPAQTDQELQSRYTAFLEESR